MRADGSVVNYFEKSGRRTELPDALADYRFGRIDWRTGTGGRGTSVADDVADFAEIELQLDGQSGRFARLETDLARQPQHRGIFVKDERAQRIEIMPCRARQRRAQELLTNATPRTIRADDQGDFSATAIA